VTHFEKGEHMKDTDAMVPFEELIGKTATEAQSIVDARRSGSAAKDAASGQNPAQSLSPIG
jgi:hypothetical protein